MLGRPEGWKREMGFRLDFFGMKSSTETSSTIGSSGAVKSTSSRRLRRFCCISRFLRGRGDINALLDHVDHVVKTVGADHVTLGTDVAYTSQNAAAENKKVPPSRSRRPKEFRSLWPADDYRPTNQAARSIAWTNWPLFTVGLVGRGYSDEDIRKIIGGNVLRVARVTLGLNT